MAKPTFTNYNPYSRVSRYDDPSHASLPLLLLTAFLTKGIQGPTGATGAQGPIGSSIASSFAYTGCFGQTCVVSSSGVQTCPGIGASYGFDSAATKGGFQQYVTSTTGNSAGKQCANICQDKGGINFFGLVNVASSTTQVACYCGVNIVNSAGFFAETNCAPCNPSSGLGTCGNSGSAIAVYGRGF
jgi:hypothetical protein